MRLKVKELDTQFGLFPWHAGIKSRLRESCDCCGVPVNPQPQKPECQICFTDEMLDDICGCKVGACFRPDDDRQANAIDGSCLGFASSVFGDCIERKKVHIFTRKMVLAFYQEFVARLGISRTLTNDYFDRMLEQGLRCKLVDCGEWVFPDGVGRALGDALARHLSGVVLSPVRDGKLYREMLKDVIQFVNRSPVHRNLYPITPLGECVCHRLPCSTMHDALCGDDSWFCNEAVMFQANCGKCNSKRFVKFLRRLGVDIDAEGKCTRRIYDNWLADLSLRVPIPQIGVCYNTNYCDCIKPCDCGIVPISAKDRGILFNDFIDKLAKGWCGVDECHLCYARLTHQCGTMFPSIGDISGQFGAMWNDRKTHYNGNEMSGLRSGHSTKFHAPLFGYANTVLGGFGQNVAFYPEREFGLRVGRMNAKRTIVAAPRYMGCGCRPIGYCIDNSGYCWAFCVAEQEKYANRSSEVAPCVTVGATVHGYGAAQPWIGGSIHLGFLCDPLSHPFDCGEYTLCDLLHADIQCSGRLWGCNRWIGYQDMNGVEGSLSFELEASWMCLNCDSEADDYDCICMPVGCWCDNYPARSVLARSYKAFVRDLNLILQLADRQERWHDCGEFEGVHDVRAFGRIPVGRPDTDCGRAEHWFKAFVRGYMTQLYSYLLARVAYRTAGFYHHSCQRSAGELPDTVVTVKKFPVTEEDVFGKGNASLLDSRPTSCWLAELNDPNNIYTEGYIARKIVFGIPWWSTSRVDIQPIGAWYQDINGEGGCWYGDLTKETFKIGSACGSQREVSGWEIGYRQILGDFHSVYRRWEPYYMPVRHHITKLAQFGIVNWNGLYHKCKDT